MKRSVLVSLLLASATVAYACSSQKASDTASGPVATEPGPTEDPGPTAQQDDSGAPVAMPGPKPGSADPNGSPLLLGPPKIVRSFVPVGGDPYFVDGPQWSPLRNQLFASLPFASNLAGGRGVLTTFKDDGTNYTELRAGNKEVTGVIGNSLDKDGNLISAELKAITRTMITPMGMGAFSVIARGYLAGPGGLPVQPADPGPNDDAGVPPMPWGVTEFDTPNDLVALDDGTIFVTDPGYEVDPRPAVGHLFMIEPGQNYATIVAAYDYNPSPNGIALTKDQKTLLVGFSQPIEGTPPFIRKYTIGADHTAVDAGKLLETPTGSSPDGIAVDDNGNIYVALKGGIAVYKANGEPYGGAQAKVPQTAVPEEPTGLGFGGADRKSLFVTTKSGKVFEFKTNVPGLLQ